MQVATQRLFRLSVKNGCDFSTPDCCFKFLYALPDGPMLIKETPSYYDNAAGAFKIYSEFIS